MSAIEATVKSTLADVLCRNVSDIRADTTLEEMNTDSLDIVEIRQAVEEDFDITVTDEEAEKVRTVQDLIDLVKGKVHA